MNERETALTILERVFKEDAYISLLMRDMPADRHIAFISEVVYGTVRNYDLLEYQWRHFAHGHVKRKTALDLDMSCYQLFFMKNEQPYAIVNDAVNAASRNDRGFVNAVLHKVIEQGCLQPSDFAIETSHPAWLLSLWKAHYGEDTMHNIALADQKSGHVFGRINLLKTTKEELEKDPLIHFLNEISFLYDGVLPKTDYFSSGTVLIQDVHSAEVVTALDVHPGMKVLDMCAAPGTKTQEIAMFMHNEGEITAGDLYPARLKLIDALMAKTGVTIVKTQQSDALKAGTYPLHAYDRILCDVPCSGLGDLRHKPEIRLHITPEKMDELVQIQHQILNNAAAYLKPHGKLVYSTCTLNKKENERQVAAFLQEHPAFHLLEEKTRFPFEEDGDGFYHAVLQFQPEN